MPVRIKKGPAILAIIIMISAIALRVYSGSSPPGPGTANSPGSYNVPNGSFSQTQPIPFRPYNATSNMQNSTMTFDVLGIESQQPPAGVIFNVATTGSVTAKFIGAQPTVICALCTKSYSAGVERIVYAAGVSDVLTVIWNNVVPSFIGEPKRVIFLDDFIHSNPLLSSSWTIDNYAASGTIPGEYTTAGFAAMVAQSSSSVETIHVSTPVAYSPSAYSDNMIVKRKLTASLFPFQKIESNTANIRVGMGPLLTTGAYPGNAPYGTPNIDYTNNCASSPNGADNIGIEYMAMGNDGNVVVVTCGDGGSNRLNLVNSLDLTLYTVFTIVTSGVFCSACVDNVFIGTAWTWFRVYQNDKSGSVIASTDKSINFTTGIAPLAGPHPMYIFASLQNGNGAATHQTSYIDLIQLQNYGSPVCLFGCLPPIFEHGNLPPVLSSIWAALVNAADVLGQGDIGFGSMLLFGLFTLVPIVTFAATRSTMLASAEFLAVLGIMMASGLFGSIWIFAVVLATAYLGWGIIKKMFLGGGGMGSMGGEA